MTRKEVRDKVADYIRNHPQESYKAIGLKLECSASTVNNIVREHRIVRKRSALNETDLSRLDG